MHSHVLFLSVTLLSTMVFSEEHIIHIKYGVREISVASKKCSSCDTPTKQCSNNTLLHNRYSHENEQSWHCNAHVPVCLNVLVWKSGEYDVRTVIDEPSQLHSTIVTTFSCAQDLCMINVYKEKEEQLHTNISACSFRSMHDQTINSVVINYLVFSSLAAGILITVAVIVLSWKICEIKLDRIKSTKR